MEYTPIQFLQKLNECVKEYKTRLNETRDDIDSATFFDLKLKTFLKTHNKELNILATMSFEKTFMSFLKSYLLKDF